MGGRNYPERVDHSKQLKFLLNLRTFPKCAKPLRYILKKVEEGAGGRNVMSKNDDDDDGAPAKKEDTKDGLISSKENISGDLKTKKTVTLYRTTKPFTGEVMATALSETLPEDKKKTSVLPPVGDDLKGAELREHLDMVHDHAGASSDDPSSDLALPIPEDMEEKLEQLLEILAKDSSGNRETIDMVNEKLQFLRSLSTHLDVEEEEEGAAECKE